MYAVVSFRRIDGAVRKTPRIYRASLGTTPWSAWSNLFRRYTWPDKLGGGSKHKSIQIRYLKDRLDAIATRVRFDPGPEGALELVLEYSLPDWNVSLSDGVL